ncbi:MAG: PepSY domain-containing protein [Candidatus Pristimantibacillus lignocellulolyticus]|uniref:PepSY domain-containing protein n=1 Tax=Candidatus Pristimantibacillus lignocellulolyticus TaxID=2994561 RepID=A0A9J6ZJ19_9BACL|nr:MAG: PepSY domain-containing protein [Candidatus Pristimantibacillus lignocellulolyticus]
MNKRVKIFALSAAVLIAGLVGTSAVSTNVSADSNKKISSERAQQLALTAVQGKVKSVELEHDDGITYYDFDIVKNKQEYDVHIDAYTGETLKVKIDDDKETVQQQKPANTATNNTTNKKMISAKEAATIAANHVKGTVQSTDKDTDDGIHLYEVELTTSRGEVEVDVDAYTGKILSVDYDDDDHNQEDHDDDHDDDDDDDDDRD